MMQRHQQKSDNLQPNIDLTMDKVGYQRAFFKLNNNQFWCRYSTIAEYCLFFLSILQYDVYYNILYNLSKAVTETY